MKLLTRSTYILLFMGFSLMLNATAEPKVSIRSQKGFSFSLHLVSLENENYYIKLRDEKGTILLNEKVEEQNDYLKVFNLKNLPTGNYDLSIENDQKIIFQNIHVLKRQLTIDPANRREIDKPSSIGVDNKLNLKATTNTRKKLIKKRKDVTKIQKNELPLSAAEIQNQVTSLAIKNRINWLRSKKN